MAIAGRFSLRLLGGAKLPAMIDGQALLCVGVTPWRDSFLSIRRLHSGRPIMFGFNLVTHLSPEEYWFSGELLRGGLASSQVPLVISCSFLNNEDRLLVAGTYRLSQSDTSHRFTLSFEALVSEATPIVLASGHIGKLVGHLYAQGESFLALVTSPDGDAICCGIQLLDSNALRLTGAIHVGSSDFSFVATGSPDTDRVTLGNVVSMFGGSRA